MQLIQNKIKFNGYDMNINIPISTNNNHMGMQQEIDSFVMEETNKSINSVVDHEVKRYSLVENKMFNFQFYSNGVWLSDFSSAGFDINDVLQRNVDISNSFFILDVYDTWVPNKQEKILTNYLTILYKNNFEGDKLSSIFTINPTSEFNYLEIPEHKINISTVYGRFSFYNAKTGKIIVFYNEYYDFLTTTFRYYFTITLNHSNNTWNLQKNIMKEAPEILYPQYNEKYNNTFTGVENKDQNYPSGTVFNYVSQSYE
jgi:hypothetical protein